MTSTSTSAVPHLPTPFALIFILGPPGASKGTLSTYLSTHYNLTHFSIGDALRAYVRANASSPLAARITDKLTNQGFLSSADLDPFLHAAIRDAVKKDDCERPRGILLDGYPRFKEQYRSFEAWPFQSEMPIAEDEGTQTQPVLKPDILLFVDVSEEVARKRYLARMRDANDSEEKFQRRYEEYVRVTGPLVGEFEEKGMVIRIDASGSIEDNIANVTKLLEGESEAGKLWRDAVIEGKTRTRFLL